MSHNTAFSTVFSTKTHIHAHRGADTVLRMLMRKKRQKPAKKKPRIHLIGFNCVQTLDENGRIVCLSPAEYAQRVASGAAQLQALQLLLAQLAQTKQSHGAGEKTSSSRTGAEKKEGGGESAHGTA